MSSVVIIILMLLFSYFGLCQNWAQSDAEARDLKCWECNSDTTGGFCTGNHEGKSVLCPSPDYPHDKDVDTLDSYKCWIMVVQSEFSYHMEVMKGCSSIAHGFLEGANEDVMPVQPKDGCSTVEAEFEVGETERWYNITMCFCSKTNCNEKTIEGKGQEDIKVRQLLKKKNLAPSFSNPFWLQLCCIITTGLVVGMLGD